jgi:hypothetical protein
MSSDIGTWRFGASCALRGSETSSTDGDECAEGEEEEGDDEASDT